MTHHFSTMTQHLGSSAVRDILKLTQGKDILSLAGGLPADAFFPVDAVREAYERALQGGGTALQYGLTEGFLPLRERISEQMAADVCRVHPDEILMTTGSQQSIDLISRIFLDPEDVILVEAPTYLAALQVFQSYRAIPISVETDEHGMLPDDLEAKLIRHRPKFIYVIPTFSNPGGNVWSLERREAVVELCRKHGVLIFEDDPYGKLKFNADLNFPSLYSMDQQYGEGGNVIYTSTFSKTVAPGVRTGWVMAEASIIRTAAKAKQAADLHSSIIDQRALHELLGFFDLQDHIRTVSTEYHTRMVKMTSLIKARQWEGVSWIEPQGGMFLWVQLPKHVKADLLLQHAVREGVAFVPGQVFYTDGSGFNRMRLNFTHTDPHLLPEAIERMERAFSSYAAEVVSI
ncbi:PLP-dependent aminotransferase family protein [Paenibacillus sp. P96]|uniref:PLP-dependent aminotransferase family protein n=1 Tax=Paenibacillus zeirhizosphaerae TaxID=2987519 RepID=A0ABT9FQM6_9BACL|nr:PLP-dependent aminotransferase family protein [Paenibacillus sp. P96]MDP4096969.1 PLP-dependent aminotransferase family protein [Paenibacillus sp. P96]